MQYCSPAFGAGSGPSGAPSARGACAVRRSSMAALWWRVQGSREASGEARAPFRRVRGCVVAARGWWDGQLGAARCGRLLVRWRRAECGQPRGQRREVTEGKRGRRRAPPQLGRAPPASLAPRSRRQLQHVS